MVFPVSRAAERDCAGTDRSQPLLSIQVLRAVAALAVVLVHTQERLALHYGLGAALPVTATGFAGVDLFFVISGFIMVYTSQALFGEAGAARRFCLRRVARIVPLYWLISGLLLGYILFAYPNLASADASVGWIAASFLFLPCPRPDGLLGPLHGVGWTLEYEMFFYAVFAAALSLPRRRAVAAVCGGLAGLVVLSRLVGPLPLPLSFWADPIVLEFCFGMLIGLAYRELPPLPRGVSAGLVLAALALFAAGAARGWDAAARVAVWGVPSALLVAGLVLRREPLRVRLPWRALGRLGDASYALYLVHMLVIATPQRLFAGVLDPRSQPLLFGALVLAAAVAVSLGLHRWVERPATGLLQGWFERRVPGGEPTGTLRVRIEA